MVVNSLSCKEISISSDENVKKFIEEAVTTGDVGSLTSLKKKIEEIDADINTAYSESITVLIKNFHKTIPRGTNALMAILSLYPYDEKRFAIGWFDTNNADFNAQSSPGLWTPLMFAVRRSIETKDYTSLSNFISKYKEKLDLAIKNSDGQTAYDFIKDIPDFPSDLKIRLNPERIPPPLPPRDKPSIDQLQTDLTNLVSTLGQLNEALGKLS